MRMAGNFSPNEYIKVLRAWWSNDASRELIEALSIEIGVWFMILSLGFSTYVINKNMTYN